MVEEFFANGARGGREHVGGNEDGNCTADYNIHEGEVQVAETRGSWPKGGGH